MYIPRMSRARSLVFAVIVPFALACEPAATPQPQPPPGGTAQPLASGSPAPAPGSVEPLAAVAPPGEVVLHVRWKRPADTIAALGAYAKMPEAFVWSNAREAVKEMVRENLRGVVDPAAFSEVVSLDVPVDFVVVADLDSPKPKGRAALSIGLTSIEGARRAVRGEISEVGPEVWRIGSEDGYGARCALAGNGGGGGKLVCAQSYKEVTKLAPYMARGLSSVADQPADIRVELTLKKAIARFGGGLVQMLRGLPAAAEEFRIGQPVFDQALVDAAVALGDEAASLIYDLEGLTADLTIVPAGGVRASASIQLAGKKSWLAQTLLEGADHQGPAPDLFWSLPKSSGSATFMHSGSSARWTGILELARTALVGLLEGEGFATDADRKAIAALARPVFADGVSVVSASGHFDAPPAGADMITQLADSVVGWNLLGVDAPAGALSAYLGEAVKVYNRPGIQSALKAMLGRDASYLPIVKTSKAPAALGAGSAAIEITLPNIELPDRSAGGKAKTASVTAYLLVMADGSRSWLGAAINRDALAKVMTDTKAGTDTLANRSGLAALKSASHASGTFTTLKGFIGPMQPWAALVGGRGGADMQAFLNVLQGLPHGGLSPATVVFDQSATAPMSVKLTAELPSDLLDDLGFVVRSVIQLRQKSP